MLLADYPLLEVTWSIFIFFGWMMLVMLAVLLIFDNFRRRDHSGWAKAGWTLFLISVPLIGSLVYMIVRPRTIDAMASDVEERELAGYPAMRP